MSLVNTMDATEADLEVLRDQLGRVPRGVVGIAARCVCDFLRRRPENVPACCSLLVVAVVTVQCVQRLAQANHLDRHPGSLGTFLGGGLTGLLFVVGGEDGGSDDTQRHNNEGKIK